jgi:RimJ/RimL family protein N-acetyltransferase
VTFAALNADPRVMEHMQSPLTREQSDAFADRIVRHWDDHGWGLWALERRDSGTFIGFVGLSPVRFEASFAPKVEIGWRLAADHWGHGFATEAARAGIDYAFDVLGWPDIISFTAVPNARSEAVMVRLGCQRRVKVNPLSTGENEPPPGVTSRWCRLRGRGRGLCF